MLKLIVGLGNPGQEYTDTRHNLGFMLLDYILERNSSDELKFDKKLNAHIAKISIDKHKVILAKPETFVNTSGPIVAKLKNFYKVKPENIYIVHDDLDISFGSFKLSFDKNSGGHRGVESVIKSLKTKKIYRLRLGTQTKNLIKAHGQSEKTKNEFVKDFVLSRLSKKELDTLKGVFKEAVERFKQS